jgi:hypothetical protein
VRHGTGANGKQIADLGASFMGSGDGHAWSSAEWF